MSLNSSLLSLMCSLAHIILKSALMLKNTVITVRTSWACTEHFHSRISLYDNAAGNLHVLMDLP